MTATRITRGFVLLVALAALAAIAPSSTAEARSRRPVRPTWQAVEGIELNEILRDKIAAVAAIYHAKTKRTLEITSGYRSPRRQATALYNKLAVGGSLAIYKNQSLVEPLRKAYRDGRKKRWQKERIIAAMADVLEAQVARGIYLSRHMRGRAFDIRSSGLSTRQRAALRAAVAEVGGMRLIYESKPPHFHVEILDAEDDEAPDTPD